MTTKKLVLASGSPRRQQLLRQIGLSFEIRESRIDEEFLPAGEPRSMVSVLSERKAEAVSLVYDDAIILGADTIVVIDGVVLGKPTGPSDASRMLRLLSGRTHEVFTGFTLIDRPSGRRVTAVERTAVTFRPLSEGEIGDYVASGSPLDKAGAYGIQDDRGAVFVERIDGCFYNVVGMPLSRLYATMREFQQPTTQS